MLTVDPAMAYARERLANLRLAADQIDGTTVTDADGAFYARSVSATPFPSYVPAPLVGEALVAYTRLRNVARDTILPQLVLARTLMEPILAQLEELVAGLERACVALGSYSRGSAASAPEAVAPPRATVNEVERASRRRQRAALKRKRGW